MVVDARGSLLVVAKWGAAGFQPSFCQVHRHVGRAAGGESVGLGGGEAVELVEPYLGVDPQVHGVFADLATFNVGF